MPRRFAMRERGWSRQMNASTVIPRFCNDDAGHVFYRIPACVGPMRTNSCWSHTSFTALISFVAYHAEKTVAHDTRARKQEKSTMRTLERARQVTPPAMSAKDIEMARVAQRCIMEALDHSRAAAITLTTDSGEHPTVDLPPAALKLIGQLLGAMSEGRPITLVPSSQELSTVEAAHFLNVSRPFVVKEIDAGRLAHRLVGSHRRVAFEDLIAYARKMREQQASALERMAENARELGLEY